MSASSPSFVSDRYPMHDAIQTWRDTPHIQIVGADGPFAACVIADLARQLERPLLVITPAAKSASELASDLTLFSQEDPSLSDDEDDLPSSPSHIALFPEYDVGPFHEASPDRKLTLQRLTTLHVIVFPETKEFQLPYPGVK